VSLRPVSSTSTKSSSAASPDSSLSDNDADLRRPHELRALHQNIKLAYGSSAPTSTILELHHARSEVDRAVSSLGLANANHHTNDSTQQTAQIQLEQGHDLDYDGDDAWA